MTRLAEILVGLPLPVSILLKITVVLGASWILHFILAKKNPCWRIILWRCALAGLLLIPALVPFAYLQISVAPPPVPIAVKPSESTFEYSIIETSDFSQAEPVQLSQPEASDTPQPVFLLTAWLRANTWMIIFVVWSSIAIMLTLRLLAKFIQVRRKINAALEGPEHLQQLLDRITEELSCTKKVMLRYAPDMSTPFLAGLRRPIIILPERMIDKKYKSRMLAVFAHEVAHLKSQDLIWALVIRLVEVILWFHPLMWKFRNAHSLACEEVCDAVAAEYIGSAKSYSSTLAGFALEIVGNVNLAGGIPMARSSEIAERLRTLEQRFYPHSLARRWLVLSFLAAFLTLTVLGGIRLVYAESDADPSAGRVLHFPRDRSLGRIVVQDADIKRQIRGFSYYDDGANWYECAEYLGQAQGDVIIPTGKRAGLFVNKNAIEDLSPLLNLKPDDLYMLSLAFKPARDKCMPYIAHLTGLKELNLADTGITSEGMEHITKLKSLERLTLPNAITNKGLVYVSQLESLKGLYFRENAITDAALSCLAKLTSLEELVLGGKRIDDAGLVHLAPLTKLNYLMLWGGFTDKGLACLKGLSSLKILNLNHLPITDEGLRHLSGHPGLENLSLRNTQVTDQGLAYLKSMPSLKKLDIGKGDVNQNQITDSGMIHLAQINSLEHLDLPNGGITDNGLATIAKLKNLRYLWVCGYSKSPLTDAALRHVSELYSLEFLLIRGTGFTDAGMGHLAKLTNLRELHFGADLITNEGLAKLKALRSLEKLYLSDSENITISGLSCLNVLNNISFLTVKNIKQDNSGLDISGLSKLDNLSIGLNATRRGKDLVYDKLRDEDLACLAKLKNLKWFQIGYKTLLTDAGMAYLADLTMMERLTIGSPYLTDKALSCLTNMKQLNSVRIAGNFTDDGLHHLEQLKMLEILTVSSANNFSPAALQRLRDNLPNLVSFTADRDRSLEGMSKTEPNSLADNTVAPSFAVKTLDGKELKLEDYRGKVVILYFWATWCKPCVAGTPELKKLYEDMKASFGEDFVLISLSMDDSEQPLREHIKKYDLTWPQVRIGRYSRISSDYGVNDTAPKTFLIGPDGKILLTPESPQVDTKSFVENLLKNRKV